MMRYQWTAVVRWIGVLIFLLAGGCESASPDAEEEENLTGAYEELMNTEGKEDGATCSGVRPPDNAPFNGMIALTFDDGPNLTNTPQVLEILENHNVKATFFIAGSKVDTQEERDLLAQMVEKGHVIGNHSYKHVNSKTVSSSTWKKEVEKTDDILAGILNGYDQVPRYFRFPYGSASCSSYNTVTTFGYHVVGWHIDSADWCFQSAAGGYGYCSPSTFKYVPTNYRRDYTGWVLYQAKKNGGGILLMHDVHRFTAENLDNLLTRLEEEGFTFTTLTDEETFPLLNGVEPPRPPWIGDPCEDSSACQFTSGELNGTCFTFTDSETQTTKGFCTLPCEGYCPDQTGTAPTFCVDAENGLQGICASKAWPTNGSCANIPGTTPKYLSRFIGETSAPPATALVCMPK